jgi:enoyl-CoA hydratase/carnithine racemase
MTGAIAVTDEGAVRVVRINRPEKKNALTLAMYADMTRALREANQGDAVRCVMIAGTGGVFTAGNDITDFMNAALGNVDFATGALQFLDALARSQKPVVAAVAGLAVGIGTTMLFHCDHVVAGASATFSTPFLKLGLIPEAASTLLAPRRMGYTRAFSLLVLGRALAAADAREGGLVNTVVDDAAVDQVALAAAREIAALPPRALAVTRDLMRGNIDEVVQHIEAEGTHFAELLKSDEARAAFAAFLARKK